jgi:hypothetical protein
LNLVAELAPFGINYLVNSRTFSDLDDAVAMAGEVGAVEILMLPEQPSRNGSGIDANTSKRLRNWVAQYRGATRLSVSEAGARGLPTCNPFSQEVGLRSFAHIDAFGTLKRSSFDAHGIVISEIGVIQALRALMATNELPMI